MATQDFLSTVRWKVQGKGLKAQVFLNEKKARSIAAGIEDSARCDVVVVRQEFDDGTWKDVMIKRDKK